MYRASLVLIVLIVSALLGSGVRTLSPAAAQIDAQAGAGTRPVELLAGWNLVGWTGDDASVPDALGDALPAIDSVHTFDAARQAFDTFTTSGPGFLNTLDVILSGAGVWFFANTGVTWQQPRITGPRDVELVAGFNLVAWTGPGTFIGEAVAGIAGALDSLFVWNAPAEEFLTFGPTRPAFLNRIDALVYGDGFWLRMTQAVSWTQPDVGSEAVVASDDGSVTLTIPPGALPAGVPASTIRLQIFDGGPDALVSVLIGPDGVVFDPPATLSFLAPNGVTAALVASAAALDVRVAEARARPAGTDLGAAQLAEGEVLDLLVAMRRSGSYFLLDSPFEASLIEVRPQALVGQELLYRPTVQNLTREFSFFALIAPPGGANPFPDPVPTEVITVGLVGAFTMNPGRVCEVAAGLVLERGTCQTSEIRVSPVEQAPIPVAPLRSTPVSGGDTANLHEATAAPVPFRCLQAGEVAFEQEITVTQTVVVRGGRDEPRDRELEILPTGGDAIGRCWVVSETNPHLLTGGQVMQQELLIGFRDADIDEFDDNGSDFKLAQAAEGIRIRPLLPGDIVVTPDGDLLTASQVAAQSNGLFSTNPFVANGAFDSVGGTCGFQDFNDSFQLFEHEGYRVIPGEGNDFGVDGLSLTPDDLPPGVMGIYDGTLNADGSGTIMHFHVEDRCTHAWEVTLTNPRELNLPFPPVNIP